MRTQVAYERGFVDAHFYPLLATEYIHLAGIPPLSGTFRPGRLRNGNPGYYDRSVLIAGRDLALLDTLHGVQAPDVQAGYTDLLLANQLINPRIYVLSAPPLYCFPSNAQWTPLDPSVIAIEFLGDGASPNDMAAGSWTAHCLNGSTQTGPILACNSNNDYTLTFPLPFQTQPVTIDHQTGDTSCFLGVDIELGEPPWQGLIIDLV